MTPVSTVVEHSLGYAWLKRWSWANCNSSIDHHDSLMAYVYTACTSYLLSRPIAACAKGVQSQRQVSVIYYISVNGIRLYEHFVYRYTTHYAIVVTTVAAKIAPCMHVWIWRLLLQNTVLQENGWLAYYKKSYHYHSLCYYLLPSCLSLRIEVYSFVFSYFLFYLFISVSYSKLAISLSH